MAREKLKWYDGRTGQRMRKDGIERASYADTEDGRYEIQGEPPTFTAVFRLRCAVLHRHPCCSMVGRILAARQHSPRCSGQGTCRLRRF